MEAPIIPICKSLLAAGAAALWVSSPAFAAAAPDDLAAYLNARAADANGDARDAARSYALALAGAPGNPVIALRSYRAALDAGDTALADRALDVLTNAGAAPADGVITTFAGAVARADKRAADDAIDRLDSTPLAFLSPVLRAWQAYDRGSGDPVAQLATAKSSIGRRYFAENRALLLIAVGKTSDGLTAVLALLGPDQASYDFRVNAAQLLWAKGDNQAAQKLLAGKDTVLSALRAEPGKVTPGLAFGASRLFDRLASDLSHGDPTPLSIALARASLRLDDRDDRARLLLAQALEQKQETSLALAALDGINPKGPFAGIARAARVAVLDDAGDKAKALTAAEQINQSPGASWLDAQRYGDALVAAKRYGDAAGAYAEAIRRAGDDAGWALYLQKGGALEQAGDWPQARVSLAKAVELAPDEPLALNYLGYAELEHGGDVATAFRLIEKASTLKPADPSITDSLGWAYFQLGQTARALPLLERAAQAQPADETIHEHLGDAYWKSGRFFEARYAWRAAAVTADSADKARLMTKIADGSAPAKLGK